MFKLITRKIKIKYNFPFSHKLMSSGSDLNVKILSNGLKVVTKVVDSPLFCASLFIKCGPRYENSCNNGISHFMEHMAVSNKDIEEIVHKNCMSVTSVTTREYQLFSAVSPIEYMPQCIEVLFKIISKIDDYDETDLDSNKQHICFEACDYDNNPKSVTFDYLHQSAFQGTPLGQSVIGTTKNILSFDKCVLSDFIKQTYQPQKLFLVLCGNVPNTALIEQVNLNLHCLRYKNCNPVNTGTQRYTGSQIVYRDDSMPYAHIAIALEVPGRHSEEYLTCLVVSCLTGSWDRTQGGTITNASPLACAASTSLLCEKFETFYIPYQDVGLLGVYFISQRLGIDNMIANIQDQWMKMCTIIVKPDVQRAVNLAKFKLAKQMTGVMNFSRDIGTQLLYSPDAKTSLDLYNELSNVTDTMIKEFGYKYIYDKCPVVAAVGPTEALPPYTRIRGGMYWLRL